MVSISAQTILFIRSAKALLMGKLHPAFCYIFLDACCQLRSNANKKDAAPIGAIVVAFGAPK